MECLCWTAYHRLQSCLRQRPAESPGAAMQNGPHHRPASHMLHLLLPKSRSALGRHCIDHGGRFNSGTCMLLACWPVKLRDRCVLDQVEGSSLLVAVREVVSIQVRRHAQRAAGSRPDVCEGYFGSRRHSLPVVVSPCTPRSSKSFELTALASKLQGYRCY